MAREVRHCPMVMRLPQKVCHKSGKTTRRGQRPPPDRRLSFHSLVGRRAETPRPGVGLTALATAKPAVLVQPPATPSRPCGAGAPAADSLRASAGLAGWSWSPGRGRSHRRAVLQGQEWPRLRARPLGGLCTSTPGLTLQSGLGPCPVPGPGLVFSTGTTPSAEGRGVMRPAQTFPRGLRPGRSAAVGLSRGSMRARVTWWVGEGIRFRGLGCHHEAIQRHRPTCWPVTAIRLGGQS